MLGWFATLVDSMSRKVIVILSIIVPIVVAALVVLVLWLTLPANNDTQQNGTRQQEDADAIVPDTSLDFGACELVTHAQVKNAFGNEFTIAEPYNLGRLFANDLGDQAQTCLYYTSTDPTSEQAIYTQVYRFANEAIAAEDRTNTAAIGEPIENLGDRSLFIAITDEETGALKYEIRTDSGQSYYLFGINQTADQARVSADEARVALETLARAARYPTR